LGLAIGSGLPGCTSGSLGSSVDLLSAILNVNSKIFGREGVLPGRARRVIYIDAKYSRRHMIPAGRHRSSVLKPIRNGDSKLGRRVWDSVSPRESVAGLPLRSLVSASDCRDCGIGSLKIELETARSPSIVFIVHLPSHRNFETLSGGSHLP
jgi:hypothetical protein